MKRIVVQLILTCAIGSVWGTDDPDTQAQVAPTPPTGKPAIRRLTKPNGLSTDPAWSPDGRSLAYASDVSGNFEIWVQPVDGAEAVQLTNDPAPDTQPSWAPDGKQLVFRSERDGGGLFVIDVGGGQPRRLTASGYMPRWSPDGKRVLFSAAQLLFMSQYQRFFIIDIAGGQPQEVAQQIGSKFASTPLACWHPDGRRVSLAGLDDKRRIVLRSVNIDTEPAADEVTEWDRLGDLQVYRLETVTWSRDGKTLFLAGVDSAGLHVWRLTVEANGRRGPVAEVTARAHLDFPIALSSDATAIAFTMKQQTTRIWKYPLDANAGRVLAAPVPVTTDTSMALAPDLSRDGKKLVYGLVFEPGLDGRLRFELHEQTDAGDRSLTTDGAARFAPRISPDGRFVASRFSPDGKANVVTLIDTANLKEHQITSSTLFSTPFGWSPDGNSLLGSIRPREGGRHAGFVLTLAPGEAAKKLDGILVNPKFDIWQETYSPNGKWISFVVQEPEARWSAVFIAPATGAPWVQITDGKGWDDKPRWAPDGASLYYLTSRGGPFAVANVPVNAESGRPAGPAREVLPPGTPAASIFTDIAWMEMALAADSLALPLVQSSGAIWVSHTSLASEPTEPPSPVCNQHSPPELERRTMPRPSPEAARRRLGFTAQIEAVVDRDGTVRGLRVLKSTEPLWEPEAVRAVAGWTFQPGRCNGEVAVSTTTPIGLDYVPK